jgi:two-component system cell cycle sensor histidine kinase PleC
MENIAISIAMLLLVYTLLLVIVYQAVCLVRNEHRRTLALASAMAQAEAANQSKTAFLANMSHKLRTPLNAIIGFAEIMGSEIKGPLGDKSYKGYVQDISKSGRHLLGIIDRVLDLVRAETGAVLLDVRTANIVFVCESIARMLSAEAENSGLDLSVTATEDPLVIDTDAGKLRDILTGLVSNSIKFTPSGGHVSIRIERKGTGARISVIDDGIGISAEDMPTAAAPFGHLENVYAKTHGGVGLGLPLARKLTELLDGSFEVSPNPKGGTIVSISLPSRPCGIPANDAHAPETRPESAP